MRLLIVEDDPSIARATKVILEKNNYSADTVDNGLDALDYIDTGIYDGMILDIMLPKMNGIEVLKTIRQKGNAIPVIVLSAKSEIDDKVLGLDSGANDYLTKPFAPKELLARIRAMLRGTSDHLDSQLTFGDITLNLATCQLSCQNESCLLSNKEFQMMEMLIRRPSAVVPASLFIENIWGLESNTQSNVIKVNISYLRKKLENLGSHVMISSSRNLGYYLELRS